MMYNPFTLFSLLFQRIYLPNILTVYFRKLIRWENVVFLMGYVNTIQMLQLFLYIVFSNMICTSGTTFPFSKFCHSVMATDYVIQLCCLLYMLLNLLPC